MQLALGAPPSPPPAATSPACRSRAGSRSGGSTRRAPRRCAATSRAAPRRARRACRCRSRRRSTATPSGPNTFHASSAVKLRNGAIQRSIACAIVPERRLRRAPRVRSRRRRVEAVLEDVEVERAQVLRAEHLQLRDDRVELVDAVVAAFEHAARGVEPPTISACSSAVRASAQRSISSISASGTASVGGVEVAGVGEQEAQRVADAPVGIDDAGQDLVVDGEVARVVGRGAPEADDLGAELGRHLAAGR